MQREVTRTTLAVLSIVGLIAASFWIMRPFLVALVWATMIVVATWSPMLSLQRRLGGRRTPAIIVMTIAMLLVFVLPFWVAISTVAEYKDEVGVWTKLATRREDSPAARIRRYHPRGRRKGRVGMA